MIATRKYFRCDTLSWTVSTWTDRGRTTWASARFSTSSTSSCKFISPIGSSAVLSWVLAKRWRTMARMGKSTRSMSFSPKYVVSLNESFHEFASIANCLNNWGENLHRPFYLSSQFRRLFLRGSIPQINEKKRFSNKHFRWLNASSTNTVHQEPYKITTRYVSWHWMSLTRRFIYFSGIGSSFSRW